VVKKLKERGLVSPVLALICGGTDQSPADGLRGICRRSAKVFKTMQERAAKFNVYKIRPQDLAGAAGPPDEQA
jgi:hypothetical protein